MTYVIFTDGGQVLRVIPFSDYRNAENHAKRLCEENQIEFNGLVSYADYNDFGSLSVQIVETT